MGDARWYPLFVTSDVPVETVNSVLARAAEEKFQGTDELVGNIWVLIQGRDQQTVSLPTDAPISSLQSEFIGATVDEIGELIKMRFGENGLGHGTDEHYDWISDTCFGVIDAQTAEKHTLLFVAEEHVNMVDEASVRLSWGEGTKEDEALLKYAAGRASDEDQELLIKGLDQQAEGSADQSLPTSSAPPTEDTARRLKAWFDRESENNRPKWMKFKLKVDIALQSTYGIYQRGPLDMLTSREEFDEDGVMV